MRFLLASCLVLLASCGYTPLGKRDAPVGFVCVLHESDGIDGRFYPDLQRAFLEENILLNNTHSEYTLHIELNKDEINQIGYRYDVNPSTQGGTNRLIANEEVRIIGAKVWVEREGKVVLGPQELEGTAQYDFVDPDALNDVSFVNNTGMRVTTLDFSLGQLDSLEGSRRVSDAVASNCLVAKIATYISNSPL